MADHAQDRVDVATAHDGHDGHQSIVRTYVVIFVVLLAVTIIEVAASYLSDVGVPDWAEIAVLIALAVVKGVLVVMFYMHLRFDSNWFRFLFIAAMILATFGVAIFIVLFSYHAQLVD